MIVYNVALALLILAMAYAGTNNSALGLDASRFDLNARSNHVETEDHPTLALVDCGHVPEESNDEGVDTAVKWTGLRGLINGVHTTEIEPKQRRSGSNAVIASSGSGMCTKNQPTQVQTRLSSGRAFVD